MTDHGCHPVTASAVPTRGAELKWVFQSQTTQKFEVTPLFVDGIMYLTQPPNDIGALDAKTGRIFWG